VVAGGAVDEVDADTCAVVDEIVLSVPPPPPPQEAANNITVTVTANHLMGAQ